jgi:hypothetical protein
MTGQTISHYENTEKLANAAWVWSRKPAKSARLRASGVLFHHAQQPSPGRLPVAHHGLR